MLSATVKRWTQKMNMKKTKNIIIANKRNEERKSSNIIIGNKIVKVKKFLMYYYRGQQMYGKNERNNIRNKRNF